MYAYVCPYVYFLALSLRGSRRNVPQQQLACLVPILVFKYHSLVKAANPLWRNGSFWARLEKVQDDPGISYNARK